MVFEGLLTFDSFILNYDLSQSLKENFLLFGGAFIVNL